MSNLQKNRAVLIHIKKTNSILVLTEGGAEYVALFFLLWIIQRHFISIEGRRIRTKAATLNKKNLTSQWGFKRKKKNKKTSNLPKAQENASDQVLVLVLIVIGWEGGAISLKQSQNEVKIPDYSVTLPQLYQKSKEKNQRSTVISQRL